MYMYNDTVWKYCQCIMYSPELCHAYNVYIIIIYMPYIYHVYVHVHGASICGRTCICGLFMVHVHIWCFLSCCCGLLVRCMYFVHVYNDASVSTYCQLVYNVQYLQWTITGRLPDFLCTRSMKSWTSSRVFWVVATPLEGQFVNWNCATLTEFIF